MFMGYVIKAGETASDERIALAIENFHYKNDDVICVGKRGYITEINKVMTIENMLEKEFDTPEECLEAYLAKLNSVSE